MPTVTVVLPVFNRVDLLAGCLEALLRQTYPDELLDVVVVDNNSTEDVAAVMPDDPRFRLFHEPRKGSYAARNTGLRHASGEVIAFTDADCSPHSDWVEQGVAALRGEPQAAMVGGAIHLVFAGGTPRTGPEIYEAAHAFRQEWYLSARRYAATANVLTWRATIEVVGAFDASLLSRGDAQWGQRVAASGGLQRYAERAVVDHPARATWRELLRKQLRVARGHRDVDLVRDPRARHFAGVAKSHLGHLVTTPVTIWATPPVPGTLATARYLGVYTAVRLMFIGASVEGLVRVLGQRWTSQRSSRP